MGWFEYLAAPFQKQENPSKLSGTNLLGIVVMCVILVIITCVGIQRMVARRETTFLVNSAAISFAMNDKDYMLKWARGEVKDQWGNSLVINSNGDEIQLRSKGPDGILGTKDDVISDLMYRQPIPIEPLPQREPVKEPKPLEEQPSLKDRAIRVWDKFWKKS